MRFPWRFLALTALLLGTWMGVFATARGLGLVPLLTGVVLALAGATYLTLFGLALRARRGR